LQDSITKNWMAWKTKKSMLGNLIIHLNVTLT
jgi:hypothetical protein